jgi:aldehyde:ferredoxin oxidoreductase
MLARIGIRGLILEDAPDDVAPRVLYVSEGKITLSTEPDLKGMEVSSTFELLRKRFGDAHGLICIGPAGDFRLHGASVAVQDAGGSQTRYAGRGGLGAVLGSKSIKALVIDGKIGAPAPLYDPDMMRDLAREFARILMEDPKTENRHVYGTPAVLGLCNELGILPTRNFSSGQFEKAIYIDGEAVKELIDVRGGESRRGLPCMKGCVIRCSNVFAGPEGGKTVGSLQYENIALLGSNLDIGDLDEIAELNRLCNEMGLDAIEAGAALGVAMEAGVLPFGNAVGAKQILAQVGQGTPLGKIIGSGVCITGKVFGVRRVPAVRGQAIPAYDPRGLKGIGVTYVTSPMGADHTAGNALETVHQLNPLSRDGQVEISRRLQLRAAILDTMGLCLFVRPAFVKQPDLFSRMLKARYGWNWTLEDVLEMGSRCLEDEHRFNELAGVSEDFCEIPEFMRSEPLPPRNTVFDLSLEQMKNIWREPHPKGVF